MSGEREENRTPIDVAIDRVVRSLTAGEPRPDLAHRVVDRIEAARRARLPWTWLVRPAPALIASAALAAVLVALVPWMRVDVPAPGRPEEPAAVLRPNTSSTPASPAPSTTTAAHEEKRVLAVVAARGPVLAGAGASRDVTTAAHVPGGLAALAPIAIPPIEAPWPGVVQPLDATLDAIGPESIAVDPIALEPLYPQHAPTDGEPGFARR
jgi:hypothetical protein